MYSDRRKAITCSVLPNPISSARIPPKPLYFNVLIHKKPSYDLLKRDIEEYAGMKFYCQVIDEAQYIKNYNTQAAKHPFLTVEAQTD